jgi:hypothetical protein
MTLPGVDSSANVAEVRDRVPPDRRAAAARARVVLQAEAGRHTLTQPPPPRPSLPQVFRMAAVAKHFEFPASGPQARSAGAPAAGGPAPSAAAAAAAEQQLVSQLMGAGAGDAEALTQLLHAWMGGPGAPSAGGPAATAAPADSALTGVMPPPPPPPHASFPLDAPAGAPFAFPPAAPPGPQAALGEVERRLAALDHDRAAHAAQIALLQRVATTLRRAIRAMAGQWRDLVAGMQAAVGEHDAALRRHEALLAPGAPARSGDAGADAGAASPRGAPGGGDAALRTVREDITSLRIELGAARGAHAECVRALEGERVARRQLEGVVIAMQARVERMCGN